MLFAEASNEQVVGIGAGTLIVGSAVTWLWNTYSKVRQENKAEKKEEEKGVVEHLRGLVERQDQTILQQNKEIGELRTEIRTIWTEMRRIELRETKAIAVLHAHIKYLEGICKDAGMSFRKYDYDSPPDSSVAEASSDR